MVGVACGVLTLIPSMAIVVDSGGYLQVPAGDACRGIHGCMVLLLVQINHPYAQ